MADMFEWETPKQVRPFDPQEAQGWGIQALSEPINEVASRVLSDTSIKAIVLLNIVVAHEWHLRQKVPTPNGLRPGEKIYDYLFTFMTKFKEWYDQQSAARSGKSREQMTAVLSSMSSFNPMFGGQNTPVQGIGKDITIQGGNDVATVNATKEEGKKKGWFRR